MNTSTPLDHFRAALEAKGFTVKRDGSGYRAQCPAHGGQDLNLKISAGADGRVLLDCKSRGCSAEAITAAIGLAVADLFPDRSGAPQGAQRQIVATYPYRDASGELRYEVVRFSPKGFSQRRPDGRGGWLWNLSGVASLLYRLPELIAAGAAEPVFITEGEKAADALAALGLIATCSSGGAGHWKPQHAQHFVGRTVAILADDDEPGRKHADAVARSLFDVAESVRLVELPNLPPKGDVADWLADGGSKAALLRLAEVAPITEPADAEIHSGVGDSPSPETKLALFLTGAELATKAVETVEWSCRGIVAPGVITDLSGPPKAAGKSTFLAYMVRNLLDGEPFCGLPTRSAPAIFCTEQGPESFRELAEAAGLVGREDFHVLFRSRAGAMPFAEVMELVTEKAAAVGAAVVILDTFPAWARIEGDAENSAGAALAALEPVRCAADAGLGVILVRHDRKSGGAVGQASRGSSAFAGAADILLQLRRPETFAKPGVRELVALSRFAATPDHLVIELVDGGYLVRESTAVAADTIRAAILDALPDRSEQAATADELAARCELPDRAVREMLAQLVAGDTVKRLGAGKRGDPYRHFRGACEGGNPAEFVSGVLKGSVSPETFPTPLHEARIVSGDAASLRAPETKPARTLSANSA